MRRLSKTWTAARTWTAALCLAIAIGFAAPGALAQGGTAIPAESSRKNPAHFLGMDDSVNTDLAAQAGVPARKPYINVEEWGDLWNFVLLFGGAISGFVVGRRWDQIWGRRRPV
jgi:hypothetical protein